MAGAYDNVPFEYVLASLILGGLTIGRLVLWVQEAPLKPDPWEAEVEQGLQRPDAQPVCHRCFSPQPLGQWFCEHCGSAVGPYNNLMPYVNAFSEGEVFRNGVTDRMRASPLTLAGYLLASLHSYVIFAPVYWFFLLRNLFSTRRSEVETTGRVAP
jgi:hypothetical protein